MKNHLIRDSRFDMTASNPWVSAEGAKVLGVTRQAMNNLVSGKAGISAEMAIRLEKAFGVGTETWLRMQAAYDLPQAE